jgi:hypothetical protein
MAARLQFINGVKFLPGASAVAQRQFSSNLHTKAASSRWAKTPENFKNVMSWFAQVNALCFLFERAPAGLFGAYSQNRYNMFHMYKIFTLAI